MTKPPTHFIRRTRNPREPSPPSCTAGLGPTGFDPARDFRPNSYADKPRHMPKRERHELNALVTAIRDHMAGLTDYRKGVLLGGFRKVSPINCSWQHYGLAELFVYELAAIVTEARRAETENTGSVHEGAGRKASPKQHSPTSSQEKGR